ncbi:translocation/assembly module TamB domain-containing protein [Blattabacterium cuenoti]|uniref:translocation/assembly module TamB domain-containing protein n=1 Tax=Blattabacterium cuenoti TaxID=1653831 RepID=UPI00163B8D7C|nr:translocation/assembly module TamB domain-containing protein [Blattabacterium cuenoti]
MNNAFFYKFHKKKILILFFLLGLFFFYVSHKQEIKEKTSTFLLKRIRNHLNDKITIKHASIDFLEKEFIFYNVQILDHHRFSFIHLSKCKISIDNLLYFIFINSDNLKIKNIFVENSSFFIKKYFNEKENNVLVFIKNILIHQKSNKFNVNFITCSKLTIHKSYIKYKNINTNKGFQHFFSSCIKNVKIDNKKVKASIFSFQSNKRLLKKSKFPFIENIFCDLTYYYPSRLKINNLLIKTSSSYLKGYLTIFQDKAVGNKILFPKINIQCKIFEGSKLGSDLGIFFYKKWGFYTKVFIRGYIHGKFNHKEKTFFLYDMSIKDSQKNKLLADKIHISYAKKKWKEIKFFKTLMQLNPYIIKNVIPYNLNYKFKFVKFILDFKQSILYKGDFTLSLFDNKKNLKIKGIVQNRFFVAQISTHVDFLKNQYAGRIFIEKKYFLIKKKNNISHLTSKIPLFIYNTLSNLYVMDFEGNFSKFFITLLFSHSKYKMHFIGKVFSNFQKIYIKIYNKNENNKNIKITFIKNENQSFQKIRINIYDMIIGHIYGDIKYKNLLQISCLKNPDKKEIKYAIFNFLIKKSFFDFIKPIKNKNIFSDIQISGEKKDNEFKMIFYTKTMQVNDILLEKLFIMVNSSLRKKIKIYIEKIIYKNFFSKKINISVLNQQNFWIINSKFLLKFKKQEYKEQILNFFCKKEKNFLVCYPFLSKLNINGYNWFTDYDHYKSGIIKIDFINQKYIIDNIIFFYGKQKIIIDANCIKNQKKIFQFHLKNVQLKKIFFNENIDGVANGFFLCKNIYNQIEPNVNIIIKNFSIRETILGDFFIYSFQKKKNNYEINGIIRKNSHDVLKVFGNIKNESKNQSKLNLSIIIKNFGIDNFSFFWKKMNTEVKGALTGTIQVFGYLNDLQYFGKLELHKFGIRINSTNTNYEIKNTAYINILSESCSLSTSCFVDTKYNTKGYINGSFSHKNLIQWNLIKLSINTKNLLVLDSNEKQNNFLFGKIFTHGKIQIMKKENKIRISMNNGKIMNFSHLYINPKTLKFHKKNRSESELNGSKKKEENNYFLLIDNINTIISKNTKVSIFLDKNHFIELRGEGFLFIRKRYKENMQISGQYFVKDGLYHLYKDERIPIKLEKKFKIKPGGSITWENNFHQSNINLIVYDTKYVNNVIEYIDNMKKNTENMIFTELRINISGQIQKPNINMDILFPESNENIQKKLSEKLNSFEEKTMQFVSVLILGKFLLKTDIIKNFLYFSIYGIILKKLKNILSYNNQSQIDQLTDTDNDSILSNAKNHCFYSLFLNEIKKKMQCNDDTLINFILVNINQILIFKNQ